MRAASVCSATCRRLRRRCCRSLGMTRCGNRRRLELGEAVRGDGQLRERFDGARSRKPQRTDERHDRRREKRREAEREKRARDPPMSECIKTSARNRMRRSAQPVSPPRLPCTSPGAPWQKLIQDANRFSELQPHKAAVSCRKRARVARRPGRDDSFVQGSSPSRRPHRRALKGSSRPAARPGGASCSRARPTARHRTV